MNEGIHLDLDTWILLLYTALVQNIHGPRELGVVFYLLILLISGIKLGVDFFTNE